MPSTYLLLRNNKQSGPLRLEELLQLSLQPHDLVWEEGRSASWRYPSEIEALKPFVTQQKQPTAPRQNTTPEPVKQAATQTKQPAFKSASHIYVALPAGMQQRPAEETPPPVNLEAKAEALYQRVQAFAEGRTPEEPDTRYARSLDDMKEEYGSWLVKQQQKKKHNSHRKKLVIATSVLIVTTTSFALSKWISHRPALQEQAVTNFSLGSMAHEEKNQTTTASFHPATDTFTTTASQPELLQKNIVLNEPGVKPGTTAVPAGKKKAAAKNKVVPKLNTDSAASIPAPPVPEPTPPVQPAVKKVLPLSQLVSVTGTLQGNKKEAVVTLQNNSSETLKLVAVTVTYLKKEDKPLNRETVYFTNVPPAAAPVVQALGNRRATGVRFEISTITRADGSLYLIH